LLYAFKTTVRGSDLTWTLAARIGRDARMKIYGRSFMLRSVLVDE
jgi:hypothetical protein